MLPSINDNLISRVRSSETFPRIKAAEAKLKEDIRKRKQNRKKCKEKEMHGDIYKDDHPSGQPKKQLFSSHILDDDAENAKYMLYNEVSYPKLFQEGDTVSPVDAEAVMDKLWVAGFLDRAGKDREKYELARASNRKQVLPSFTKNMDQASVVSSSSVSSTSTQSTKSKSSVKSAYKFDPSDAPWSSAASRRASVQSVVTGGATIESENPTESTLSVNDQYRLKVLEDSLKSHEAKKKKKKKELVKGIAVYAATNKSIKRNRAPAKVYPDSFSSFELENVFERERIENLAAKKIQRAYIHSCVIHKLRFVFVCMKMAVRIQRFIRGVSTRRRVAQWYKVKTELATQWQARVRKWRSNKYLRKQQAHEKQCATKIQAMVLGKLARLKVYNMKRHLAAERIQTTWRGVVARSRADRMWLSRTTIPIQTIARKMVAKMRYASMRVELNEAAVKIQRCFRSWSAVRRLASTLHRREDLYRDYTAAMLTAEEEWADDTILKLSHRLEKKGIRDKLRLVVKDYQRTLEDIHFKENDYIEINRQKDILSARAIQQGWLHELTTNLIGLRRDITDMKLKCVFKKQHLLKSLEHQLIRKVEEIEEVARYRDMIADCREMEVEDNRVRDFIRNTLQRRRDKQMAIANERRKWQVKFYTPSGKPDKLRRPGRKWDPAAYAGPEKMTYCGASGVDLHANMKPRMLGAKVGSDESLQQVVNEVSLQNYLQQVNHYEQLLNPIAKIMQDSLGAPPGQPHPKDSGWGPVGESLPLAMEHIGAIPAHWRGDREEYERQQAEARQKRAIEEAQLREMEALEEERKKLLSANTDGMSEFADFFDHEGEETSQVSQLSRDNTSLPTSISKGKSKRHIASKIPHSEQISTSTASSLSGASFASQASKTKSKGSETTSVQQQVVDTKKREPDSVARLRAEKRKARLRERQRGAAVIPWALLDQLDGEKKKFEAEVSYTEFYHKI